MARTNFLLTLFLLFLLSTPTWAATTFYVAKSGDGGSDSNTCTQAQSVSTPKLTILAGLNCMVSGDTLRIRAGTYTEHIYGSEGGLKSGADWTSPTKIEGYSGDAVHSVILRPSSGSRVIYILSGFHHIWFDNLDLDGSNITHYVVDLDGVNVAGSGFIRVSNSIIHGSPSSGVIAGRGSNFNEFLNNKIHTNGTAPITGNCCGYGLYLQTDDNVAEGNEIYNHTGYGVHVYNGFASGDVTADRNRIRRNFVHDNCTALAGAPGVNGTDATQSASILIGSGDDNRAEYNIETGCPFGIMIGQPDTTNNKAYNNTVYGLATAHGATARIAGVLVRAGTDGTVVQNNLLYNNTYTTASGVRIDGTQITPVVNTSNSTADPDYLDGPGGDFALLATSTAIDAGTPIAGYPFNGAAPDRGAHETFTCASAIVPDTGSDNSLVVTCESNLRAPTLPATSCTGFSVQKNGSPNAVTACTRTGTNVFTLDVTDSYINTDTAHITYSTSTGNLSDSADIGGAPSGTGATQRLNAITTPQLAINQVGESSPVLTQVACRFERYGGTESAPDTVLVTGGALSLPPGGCGRVRCQVSNTVADVGPSGYPMFVQKNGSGGYVAMANAPGSPTSIWFPGSGTLPPQLVSGPTTEQLAGAGVFIAGGVLFSDAEIPNITLGVGDDTELVAPFCAGSSTVGGDFFDFRLYQAGGIALGAYTQTPRVNIVTNGYVAVTGDR